MTGLRLFQRGLKWPVFPRFGRSCARHPPDLKIGPERLFSHPIIEVIVGLVMPGSEPTGQIQVMRLYSGGLPP